MWHITLNQLIKQLTMGDSVEGFADIKSREVHSTTVTVLSKLAGNLLYSNNCITAKTFLKAKLQIMAS